MIGLIYLFAGININPGKNDAILMAGFVRSDTDTTPLGIMMMARRSLLLGTRMKMIQEEKGEDPKDMGIGHWVMGSLAQVLTRVDWVS